MNPVNPPTESRASNKYVGPRVRLCEDGKYRWTFEVNMLKNPSFILVLLKIFGVLFSIPFLVSVIRLAAEGTLQKVWHESIWSGSNPKIWLFLMAVLLGILLVSYLIVAWMYGGKYIAHFTLDEECVVHEQEPAQLKRAQKLNLLTVLVGILAKRPSTVGAGMLAASRTSSTSIFANVRRVKSRRAWHLIKVNQLLDRNQVFVPDEDFDFVLNFIKSHCPRAK